MGHVDEALILAAEVSDKISEAREMLNKLSDDYPVMYRAMDGDLCYHTLGSANDILVTRRRNAADLAEIVREEEAGGDE